MLCRKLPIWHSLLRSSGGCGNNSKLPSCFSPPLSKMEKSGRGHVRPLWAAFVSQSRQVWFCSWRRSKSEQIKPIFSRFFRNLVLIEKNRSIYPLCWVIHWLSHTNWSLIHWSWLVRHYQPIRVLLDSNNPWVATHTVQNFAQTLAVVFHARVVCIRCFLFPRLLSQHARDSGGVEHFHTFIWQIRCFLDPGGGFSSARGHPYLHQCVCRDAVQVQRGPVRVHVGPGGSPCVQCSLDREASKKVKAARVVSPVLRKFISQKCRRTPSWWPPSSDMKGTRQRLGFDILMLKVPPESRSSPNPNRLFLDQLSTFPYKYN